MGPEKHTAPKPSRVSTNPSKRLEDAPQHVLGDVEVKGAHVEPHGAHTASVQATGSSSGRRTVLLRLELTRHTVHKYMTLMTPPLPELSEQH